MAEQIECFLCLWKVKNRSSMPRCFC